MARNDGNDADSPLMLLLASLTGVPRRIYEQGVARGDELRQRRELHNGDSEGYDGSCRRRKISHQSADSSDDSSCAMPWMLSRTVEQTKNKSVNDDNSQSTIQDDNADDWFQWVKHEVARREKKAKDLYDSWDSGYRKDSSPDESQQNNSYLDELEKSRQEDLEALLQFSSELSGPPDKAERFSFGDLLSNMVNFGSATWMGEDENSSFVSHMAVYAASNAYSPLQLEHQPGFDASWRARYEDLIRAQTGRPLLTEEEIDSTKQQSSLEWLGRLLLKNHISSNKSMWDHDSDHQVHGQTELDAYDMRTNRSEGSYLGEAIRKHRQRGEQPSTTQEADQSKSVKSFSRTIKSHTEPDGSIVTKTVIHRRFEDGREESSESTERKPFVSSNLTAQPKQGQSHPTSEPQNDSQSGQNRSQNPGIGWFWSK